MIYVKFKVSVRSRAKKKKWYLTWVLLISARLSITTVWFVKDCSRNTTLLPLPNPPIADTPQENLGGTPPANLLTRRGWVGVNTPGYPVNLSEELLVKKWCELFRGVLNVMNDLDKWLGGVKRAA